MSFLDKMKAQVSAVTASATAAAASSNVSSAVVEEVEASVEAADTSDFMDFGVSVAAHVVADVLNVRSTPSTSLKRVGTVKRGDTICVLGVCDEWLQIDYQGEKCYVCAEFTDYSAPAMTVTASKLNIRKGPGTNYDKLGMLDNGDVVHALAEKNGWVKILHKNEVGYISKDYLK